MDANDRRKRAGEEAAEWWVLLQGDVSRAQREQYVDWLRETPLHVAEMLRIAQVHGALEQFDRWSQIPTNGSGEDDDTVVTLPGSDRRPEAQRFPPEPTPRRLSLVWSIAVMLLVVAGLGVVLLVGGRGQTIRTERGERREVALADGSVVQVDPETRLRVKYEDHARRVFLEHGRALFRVAKNPDRPFLVEADDTTVRAVGTAFGVERQTDSIVVTVAEGRVAVFPARSAPAAVPESSLRADSASIHKQMSPGVSPAPRPSSSSGSERVQGVGPSVAPPISDSATPEIFLTANQQVIVARSGSAQPVRTVDSGRALAWADGRLIFDNSSVDDAIHQFNRYNRIQIYVNDIKVARRPISGVFSAADPESFVAFIQSVAAVRVTRNDAADITIDSTK